MLDTSFLTLSFEAKSNEKQSKIPKALILKACRVYIFSQGRIYSEFEEISFDYLNNNVYGFGTLQIEFVFLNGVTINPYPDFYTKCFVIRTNNKLLIKPMKMRNEKIFSKIDESGNLIIGISYYFQSKEEVKRIIACDSLLVEGFVSLDKPKNVYGLMCQLKKQENNNWDIEIAYTYKPKYAKNINNLLD